ncbi:EpsG family protein [Flavobacterium sp. F-65]|uniref:EpsG family protein n=1 Tax=Flavobacterium pisciphilum TaxID=2893755 RepID=A0ABS8MSH0_9FLAO|nr:EpsG family protein [Flavobacterium sp. F-65]MCC9071716.1 EpsG family protein [Flavobacterium sp. F-65]
MLSLLFISYRYQGTEKNISLVIFGILVLIGGLRDRIGLDYSNYVGWYNKGTRDDGFEFGFLAIMKVFRYLNLDYKFLFFFFSFFTYLFAYLAIRKYTKKSSLPMVLYFLIPVMFLYSFTFMRQYLSVTIAFYAFTFLLEKKYFIYFFWMLVGISFHYSCLIPFLIFFIVYKWGSFITNYHLFILMGVSFVVSRIGIIHWLSLFLEDSHYLFYVSNKFAVAVPLLKLLVINTMGVLVISYFEKKGYKNDYQRYLLLLYICSILFLNVFSESIELTRIYIYFRIFEIILIADIIWYAVQNKRFWVISFMCCFYFLPYYRTIKLDSESTQKDEFKLIPYKTLLLKEHK